MQKRNSMVVLVSLLLVFFVSGVNAQAQMWVTMPEGIDAMVSDSEVIVSTVPVAPVAGTVWEAAPNYYYKFSPADVTPDDAFIIFPGAYVPAEAYAPAARDIAAAGYLVFIIPVPDGIAIQYTDRASQIISDNPMVSSWNIGGHSLGGVVACSYANGSPDIDGIVLWASYPAGDMSSSDQRFVSIFGFNDGISTTDEIADSVPNLPESTSWVPLAGANHSQFGWYYDEAHADGSVTDPFVQPTPDPGDNPADITHEEQHAAMVQATVSFLDAALIDLPPVIKGGPFRASDESLLSTDPASPSVVLGDDRLYWIFGDDKATCGTFTLQWQYRVAGSNDPMTVYTIHPDGQGGGTYLGFAWTDLAATLFGSETYEFQAIVSDCAGNTTVSDICYIQVDLPPFITGGPYRASDESLLSTDSASPSSVAGDDRLYWTFGDDKAACSEFTLQWQYRAAGSTDPMTVYTIYPDGQGGGTYLGIAWTDLVDTLFGSGIYEFQAVVIDCMGQVVESDLCYIDTL